MQTNDYVLLNGDVLRPINMDKEQLELLHLQEEFSERTFFAGWSVRLEDTLRKLTQGLEWTTANYGFDTESCPLPRPIVLARMLYLIGKLGGFWAYEYTWTKL